MKVWLAGLVGGKRYYRCPACDVFYPEDAVGPLVRVHLGRCRNCEDAELEVVVVTTKPSFCPTMAVGVVVPMLLGGVEELLNQAILMTPTGEVRNRLTEANILAMAARRDVGKPEEAVIKSDEGG